MKTLVLLFVTIFSVNIATADDQVTGTITLSGVLAPKALNIQFAVNDCGAGTTLAACVASLNGAAFAGHAQDVSLNIGNIADGESNVRYVQFEAKSKMILFANDYLQFIAALTASTNDIDVALQQLNFVSGGKSTFGQTTLGAVGVADLAANEPMLDAVDIDLSGVLTPLWDQTADNPAQPNDKVFLAVANGDELVIRGVLEVAFGEDATSSAYNAVITAGFIAKDN